MSLDGDSCITLGMGSSPFRWMVCFRPFLNYPEGISCAPVTSAMAPDLTNSILTCGRSYQHMTAKAYRREPVELERGLALLLWMAQHAKKLGMLRLTQRARTIREEFETYFSELCRVKITRVTFTIPQPSIPMRESKKSAKAPTSIPSSHP